MRGDITSPKLLVIKAGLFVVLGLLAGGLVLAECPSWRVAGLIALAVWAFARAYYFAFYVVEKYVDSSFKFAGLGSVVAYWWRRRKAR